MKKYRLLLFVLAIVIILSVTGCSAKDSSINYTKTDSDEEPSLVSDDIMVVEEMAEDGYYGDDESGTSSGSSEEIEDYSEKIIYNASFELVADDVTDTSDKIVDMVNQVGGYVSYLNKSNYSSSSEYVNMEVRVPASGLIDFSDYISTLASVSYETMSSNNITEQYYDIKTRLEHQQLQAEQLEELMKKAETTEDILAVRSELSTVQETIEVYQGRIRMWDSLVNYSTVNINISKTPTIDDNDGLLRMVTLGETGRAIVRGFQNSGIFIVNFFSFLLRLIAILIVPAVIVVPIVILVVKLIKKRRNKKKEDLDNK